VLANAMEQCRIWHGEGHPIRVSVNVSVGDLLDPALVKLVSELLGQHQLAPGSFAMEITETRIIEEFERSKKAVAQLRELGVEVSIDDFGAGVTSLAYLGGLSVAELKLDRRFIAPLDDAHESRDVELVRATIALGHALRMRVVAEGVENRNTIALLSELGCDLAQGDSIDKPSHPALVSLERRSLTTEPSHAVERVRSGSESRFRLGLGRGGPQRLASEV
jgi:EAL domain-containing protein (putative c-di-GMP-specific phosphodiesterase class I)